MRRGTRHSPQNVGEWEQLVLKGWFRADLGLAKDWLRVALGWFRLGEVFGRFTQKKCSLWGEGLLTISLIKIATLADAAANVANKRN